MFLKYFREEISNSTVYTAFLCKVSCKVSRRAACGCAVRLPPGAWCGCWNLRPPFELPSLAHGISKSRERREREGRGGVGARGAWGLVGRVVCYGALCVRRAVFLAEGILRFVQYTRGTQSKHVYPRASLNLRGIATVISGGRASTLENWPQWGTAQGQRIKYELRSCAADIGSRRGARRRAPQGRRCPRSPSLAACSPWLGLQLRSRSARGCGRLASRPRRCRHRHRARACRPC